MATVTTLTGNFAGEKAAGYLYPAILGSNTINDGLVTVHENVKYRLNIRNLGSSTGFLADATCEFSSTGTISLSDVVLQPKELQINIETCKKTYRTQWESLDMKGRLLGQDLAGDFQESFIQKNLELLARDFEVKIWQGADDATDGDFFGLQYRMANNADVVDVSGTTLTAANILTEIAKVYAAIPNEVYVAEDFAIMIPISASKLYQQAIAAVGDGYSGGTGAGYLGQSVVGAKPLDYLGIPLKVANGLANNKMVAARSSDLHFGTNVLTDMAEIDVVDMSIVGDQNVRFIARMTAGTQITNGSNIVYYSA